MRQPAGACRGRSDHSAVEGRTSSGAHPQVWQAEEKLSDLQMSFSIVKPLCRARRSIPRSPASAQRRTTNTTRYRARSSKKSASRIPAKRVTAHLERIEEIVACAAEQCTCGKCGRETQDIGYEETEELGMKPAVHFVRAIKREKRACKSCADCGVVTAPAPARIAPK